MDRDEVGPLEQVVQRDQLHVEELRTLNRYDRIVSHDLHLQAVRALGNFGADIAEADDAQRLASDLCADELRPSPLASFHRSVRLRHRTREREEQRDRVLGRGDDVSARSVDDEDSLPRRGRDVDVVDSHARAPNHPQAAPGFQNPGGHLGLAPHHQGVEVGNALDQVSLAELVDDRDLTCATKALEAVLGERVGDEDPGHWAQGTTLGRPAAKQWLPPPPGPRRGRCRALRVPARSPTAPVRRRPRRPRPGVPPGPSSPSSWPGRRR